MKKALSLFVAAAMVSTISAFSISASADTSSGSDDNGAGEQFRVVNMWDGSHVPLGTKAETSNDTGPDNDGTQWFPPDGSNTVATGNASYEVVTAPYSELGQKCLQGTVLNGTGTYDIPYIYFNTDFTSLPAPDATGATFFQFYYDGTQFSPDSTDQQVFTVEFDLKDYNADGTLRMDTIDGQQIQHIACWDASKNFFYQDSEGNWVEGQVSQSGFTIKPPMHYKGWIRIPMSSFRNMAYQWGDQYDDADGVLTPKKMRSIDIMFSGIKNANAGSKFLVGNLQFLVPANSSSSSQVASSSSSSQASSSSQQETSSEPQESSSSSAVLNESSTVSTSSTASSTKNASSNVPNTGDTSAIPIAVLLMGSAAAAVALIKHKK